METVDAPAGSRAKLPVNRSTFLPLRVAEHQDLAGFAKPVESSPLAAHHLKGLTDCGTPEPKGEKS